MKYLLLIILFTSVITDTNSQCFPDRHNTSWFDAWVSCESSQNPNSIRGKSHWILYDFGHIYKLENLHVWNINDPDKLDDGLKNVVIDYSPDGNTWVESGNAVFPKANGSSTYQGSDILDFNGIKARYMLITAKDNYGGNCFGFSELRIGVSPITGTELVNFDFDCDEKNGHTEISWTLTNESKTIAFDIERSYDGESWSVINSTGNFAVKEGTNKYSFTDKSDKDAFYRVKIIESSGKTAFSDPSYCSKGNLNLKAYPNPFSDDLKIEIFSQNEGLIRYKLTDILGRIIKSGSIDTDSSIHILDLNNLNINPGNYFLEVNQGDKNGQIKILKMDSYKN
ncbi:MAG: T9SS type A sorting domain-containing protein [Saprospiraceae bacterium]|nr:T9SS type A sorting domain-containing protein [Saprospiraceae bacterium]